MILGIYLNHTLDHILSSCNMPLRLLTTAERRQKSHRFASSGNHRHHPPAEEQEEGKDEIS